MNVLNIDMRVKILVGFLLMGLPLGYVANRHWKENRLKTACESVHSKTWWHPISDIPGVCVDTAALTLAFEDYLGMLGPKRGFSSAEKCKQDQGEYDDGICYAPAAVPK